MKQVVSSDFKLGIICGGQLGKMLALAAANWDVHTSVLDASADCPASKVATSFVQGHHMDYDAVYNFGQRVDLITFEIEHVNLEALRKLKSEGKKIFPDPELLGIIQDKGLQKEFYQKHNIPTSPFKLYLDKSQVLEGIEQNKIRFPFVQKSRKDGYDGRGVVVIKEASKLDLLLDSPCVIEEAVEIQKELSVIVARNQRKEVKCFPLVEMDFNEEANLVELLLCPADVTNEIEEKSKAIAIKVAESLNLVGLLAVELFLDKSGTILVNECAPRTHNSGHHTIENNVTSQFEQQLRAVLNLPLGDTTLMSPAVMLNVLGAPGYSGEVFYEGFEEILSIPGVNPHIYGKRETRPFRKMGHITVLDSSLSEAIKKAEKVKETFKAITV